MENTALFDFIAHCPTAFHTAATVCEALTAAGYTRLAESDAWTLEAGKGYFVSRGTSSVLAFCAPADFSGFVIAAAHGDSPAPKIKENADLHGADYTRLSVEPYGGMIFSTWLDRPLSVAGRVVVRTARGIAVRLCDLRVPVAVIPNVAIHMNRTMNDGVKLNAAVDMLPLYGGADAEPLRARVAASLGIAAEDILSADLFVYNPQAGVEWNGFISAPRLDDLQCVYAALHGFLDAVDGTAAKVLCVFDNEEVGSQTRQGAASTFLYDVLRRVSAAYFRDYDAAVAGSLMLSCDNAHAVHPNHPEYADANHTVRMNGGVVVKYNANQRYTTDAWSAALFRVICARAGVPVQLYANRADMPGGSTLGNIANTQVSLPTVDIGAAQLAMHSAYETAGAADTAYLYRAIKQAFETTLTALADGVAEIQ